jgi:hypothetical protein
MVLLRNKYSNHNKNHGGPEVSPAKKKNSRIMALRDFGTFLAKALGEEFFNMSKADLNRYWIHLDMVNNFRVGSVEII